MEHRSCKFLLFLTMFKLFFISIADNFSRVTDNNCQWRDIVRDNCTHPHNGALTDFYTRHNMRGKTYPNEIPDNYRANCYYIIVRKIFRPQIIMGKGNQNALRADSHIITYMNSPHGMQDAITLDKTVFSNPHP